MTLPTLDEKHLAALKKLLAETHDLVENTVHVQFDAEGTHSVEMIVEAFTDRMGNRALVCTAHYKDKKNKDRECTAWVKWEEQ